MQPLPFHRPTLVRLSKHARRPVKGSTSESPPLSLAKPCSAARSWQRSSLARFNASALHWSTHSEALCALMQLSKEQPSCSWSQLRGLATGRECSSTSVSLLCRRRSVTHTRLASPPSQWPSDCLPRRLPTGTRAESWSLILSGAASSQRRLHSMRRLSSTSETRDGHDCRSLPVACSPRQWRKRWTPWLRTSLFARRCACHRQCYQAERAQHSSKKKVGRGLAKYRRGVAEAVPCKYRGLLFAKSPEKITHKAQVALATTKISQLRSSRTSHRSTRNYNEVAGRFRIQIRSYVTLSSFCDRAHSGYKP